MGQPRVAPQMTSVTPKVEDYSRLINDMKDQLAAVGKPRTNRQSQNDASRNDINWQTQAVGDVDPELPTVDDDAWSSASQTEVDDAELFGGTTKPTSLTAFSDTHQEPTPHASNDIVYKKPSIPRSAMTTLSVPGTVTPPQRVVSPLPLEALSESLASPTDANISSNEIDLADEILNTMAAASPSPKKRHTLSLAERTRLSMSRTTHSKFSDLHDEYEVPDISRLSIKSRQSLSARTPSDDAEPSEHAELIERTRKSMAGFEAAQKKAQLDRRRSVKDEKRKQRQSYFPKVREDTVEDEGKVEMMQGNPDYDSVFMSRPKIATSPLVSPERIVEEDELSD